MTETFTQWLMRRRHWRYEELKKRAREPDFPRESNDMKELESSFLIAGISFPAEISFRLGWLKYRAEQLRRQRKAEG